MEWQLVLVRLAESGMAGWIFVAIAAIHAVRDIILGVCSCRSTMDPQLVDAWTRRLIAKRVVRPAQRANVPIEVVQQWAERLFETDQIESSAEPASTGSGDALELPGADRDPWWRRFWLSRRDRGAG
jgi:hypothetical protein